VLTAGVTTLGNLRQAFSIAAAAVALLPAVLSSATPGCGLWTYECCSKKLLLHWPPAGSSLHLPDFVQEWE
jgi:hypothetical protein